MPRLVVDDERRRIPVGLVADRDGRTPTAAAALAAVAALATVATVAVLVGASAVAALAALGALATVAALATVSALALAVALPIPLPFAAIEAVAPSSMSATTASSGTASLSLLPMSTLPSFSCAPDVEPHGGVSAAVASHRSLGGIGRRAPVGGLGSNQPPSRGICAA